MRSVRPLRWLGRAAILSTLVVARIGAQAAPAAKATQVTSVEGITEYSLPNGLRVLLFPDPSKPTVTVNVTYLVGSAMEGFGETGMAHLLEHMVFKPSKNHADIPAELASHGARNNGSTNPDRTNYFETVPATDENLTWALDLESDRMVNALIQKKDLESEFSVVRNELELGENDPFRAVYYRTYRAAFVWHGYGRSTIGSRSDVEGVPVERLKTFYKKYYQPDNAILVVAGKFDPAKTLAMIEQKFGSIPRPVRSLETGNLLFPPYTVEPAQDGEASYTIRRVGDTQMLMAGWHVPSASHPDLAALDVLSDVLGTGPSSRLYKALVDTKLAAAEQAFVNYSRDPSLFMAHATVRVGQSMDSVQWAMEKAIDAARAGPFTSEEVERAKTQLAKNWDLAYNNSAGIGIQLSEWAAAGDWRMLFIHRDRIAKVTPADVQRVAATYLKPQNRTYAFYIPTKQPDRAEVPLNPNIAALVADYKGKGVVQAGEVFDASPKNIEARTHHSALPNGMQLTFLSKLTRGGTVNAQIVLRQGTEKTLTGKGQVPSLMGTMLARGTTALTWQQVRDSLDKLKAQVGIGGNASAVTVNIQTLHANLVPVLELVASELKTPRFDPEELDKLKKERLSVLEANKSQPLFIGGFALQRRIYPAAKGHPFYAASPDETIADINAATLADIKAFYTGFVGASYGDLAVVGDFDEKEVAAAAAKLFGSWKSPQPYQRIARVYTKTDSSFETIETPDKPNALYTVGQQIQVKDDDPDFAALDFANFILGGAGMSSRLTNRVRGKEGLSYGANSLLNVSPFDHWGLFVWNAIYAPQNVEKLQRAFRDEIDKALKDGFTQAEIDQFRPGYLQQMGQTRASDPQLLGLLVQRRFAGRTMTYDENLEKAVSALTPEQLNAAVRKYINPSQIVIVRVGDFAKNPPAKATP